MKAFVEECVEKYQAELIEKNGHFILKRVADGKERHVVLSYPPDDDVLLRPDLFDNMCRRLQVPESVFIPEDTLD